MFQISKNPAEAAYLENIPQTLIQPDGTVFKCLASGDEYFNRLHDENGYTIIQNPETGFYDYAILRDERIMASGQRADQTNPVISGFIPGIMPSSETILKKAMESNKRLEIFMKNNNMQAESSLTKGEINNIVIFIRFADDDEFRLDAGWDFDTINNMLNSDSDNSMFNYFYTVSNKALEIYTHFYPEPNGNIILSYQDSMPRSYYQLYNKVTNPEGYRVSDESYRRSFLLGGALNYIQNEVHQSIDLDANGDGYIDNICFIVSGSVEAWSDLLWPHRSYINYSNVKINGKKPLNYNFQLSLGGMLQTRVLAHEMFHTLGAPDLYHYSNDGSYPVGPWDIMGNSSEPPAGVCAYMKLKYGGWINDLPIIDKPGQYTLQPFGATSNDCYMISSPVSDNEFFVVEYRKNDGVFIDSKLPGSGLLIYRVNPELLGNANGPPDEVYIYRPNETETNFVRPDSAFFSKQSGRIEISNTTNPKPFLSNGGNGYLHIYDISEAGETISFSIDFDFPFDPPVPILPDNESPNETIVQYLKFEWTRAINAISYNIQLSTDPDFVNLIIDTILDSNSLLVNQNKLTHETKYYWRVNAYNGNETSNWSEERSFTTEPEHKGIFVLDAAQFKEDYNAQYIASFLKNQGHKVYYSDHFPSSLLGFDAVFLSFGGYCYTAYSTQLSKEWYDILLEYIESGGNIYIESVNLLSHDNPYIYEGDLLRYFGLNNSSYYTFSAPINNLKGVNNSLAEGMIFTNSTQINNQYISSLVIADTINANPIFIESDSILAAVQYEGGYGQKTIGSIYSLSALVDKNYPSTKGMLINRILDFFGLSFSQDYYYPDFTVDKTTGHAPLEVQFNLNSQKNNIDENSIQWDFDADGMTDSEDTNPVFNYTEPGTYSVLMNVRGTDGHDYQSSFRDTIHVFNSESSLKFDPNKSAKASVKLSETLKLDGPFTIEEWIYPTGIGSLIFEQGYNTKNGALAFYKEAIQIYMPNQRTIRVELVNEDGSAGIIESARYELELNKWQHIAVTYDGKGDIKVYLNGILQINKYFQGYSFTQGILNTSDNDKFVIGNAHADFYGTNMSFDGKIDEVRLWNIERNPFEIADNMLDTLQLPQDGLIGYWKLSEGSGTTFADYSGNDNHGIQECMWAQGWMPETQVSVYDNLNINDWSLFQNYPNPVSDLTNIVYNLEKKCHLSIRLYDLLGNKVIKVIEADKTQGKHLELIDVSALPPGIYYCVMSAGNHIESIPIMIMR
ncbi:M6 family metalloprotease domain-containing protein [Bacteroidota bacterium]